MNRRHHTPAPRRQAGWTLIEMVMVVTATAVLSGVGVSFIALLMETEQTGTVAFARQRTTARMARQLQHDGHLATDVELVTRDDAPAEVRLILPDRQIVIWSARADTVTRLRTDSSGKQQREAFHIAGCAARWTLTDDARLLSLHLSSGPPEAAAPEPDSVESFASTVTVNVGRLLDRGRQLQLTSTDRPDNGGEEEVSP